MAPNFCAGTYPWGDGKRPTYYRGGVAKCAKGIQNAHFAKGQKLTHSPAHEEKHVGQETPLHYTPYLQWHHPGGRALLQLAQAPTQDYHSYMHTLLGVVEEHVVDPNDPPVKKRREHSAAKQLWPNRGRHNVFPLLGLGRKRCSFCVHCVDVDGVELPSPLLAEVQSIVCVICALA